MKFKGIIAITVIVIIGFSSCEKIFMKPKADSSQTAVFEEYVKLVKEKYGMLAFKELDIIHLSDSLRPFVNNEMTDDSLFATLAIITRQLKDGHSVLFETDKNGDYIRGAGYDLEAGYPISFHQGILNSVYLGSDVAPEIKLIEEEDAESVSMYYGFLPQDSEIAYIRIPSFDTDISKEQLEMVFKLLNPAKGMIVDMRNNGGGSPILATQIAAYFTNKEISIGYENFKIGPGANDFSKSYAVLKPANTDYLFLKPVMVLTDRGVYSATTTFCYSVNPLNNVTFVGQRTGGGSGSVADGYLANGWTWNMSISEFVGIADDGSEQHLDNGFEPDIHVLLDTLDITQDEIMERAIFELQ